MKIYTRTGDAGETGLLDGRRVSKAEPRVDAYGEVDELNACLGLVLSAGIDSDLADMVVQIQPQLFSLGASLADPTSHAAGHAKASVGKADVERLEGWIDLLEAELEPLRRAPEALERFQNRWRFTTTEKRQLARLLTRCLTLADRPRPEDYHAVPKASTVLRELDGRHRSLALEVPGF